MSSRPDADRPTTCAERYDVFISYNSQDAQAKNEVARKLAERGIAAWIDRDRLKGGDDFPDELARALSAANVIIYLRGSHGMGKWQKEEYSLGIIESVSNGKLLVPILLAGSPSPDQCHDMPFLKRRHHIDCRDGMTEKDISDLVTIIEGARHPVPRVWTVSEARDMTAFDEWLRSFEAEMAHVPDDQYIVTLYGRSFPTTQSPDEYIGEFYYDLLHYHGLRQPPPMFGPLIEGDYRLTITSDPAWRQPGELILHRPPGGFCDREGAKWSYWFKLGSADAPLYSGAGWPAQEHSVSHEDVGGLLLVLSRSVDLRPILGTEGFRSGLARLERVVCGISERRQVNRLGWHSSLSSRRRELRAIARRRDPDTDGFFARIGHAFTAGAPRGASREHVELRVYSYNQSTKLLEPTWTSAPTSGTPEPCGPGSVAHAIVEDGRRRPLLFDAPPFFYGERGLLQSGQAQSVVVVPVLSPEDPDNHEKLVGAIEVWSSAKDRFDTDDVQRLYDLCQEYIAEFLSRLALGRTGISVAEAAPTLVPARSGHYYEYADHLFRRQVRGHDITTVTQIELQPGVGCGPYKCPHCYGGGPMTVTNPLTMDDYRHLLDQVERYRPLVQISGVATEPLTFKHIVELLNDIKSRGLSFGLHTKGYRLDNDIAQCLTDGIDGSESFVTISIDAADASVYKRLHNITSSGSHLELVMANLRSLYRINTANGNRLKVNVAYLLFRGNSSYDHINRFIDLVGDHCDVIRFSAPHVANGYSGKPDQLANYLTPAEAEVVLGGIEPNTHRPGQVKVLADTCNCFHSDGFAYCYAQVFQVVIDAEGRVFPCPQTADRDHRHLSYGSIREGRPLRAILASPQRRAMLSNAVASMKCRVCDRKDEAINIKCHELFGQPLPAPAGPSSDALQ